MIHTKRLEELERRFVAEPIALEMPDGRTKFPRYSDSTMFGLLGKAMKELNAGTGLSPEIALIKESVSGTEAGGEMINLCRAILNGPDLSEEEKETSYAQ